MRQQAVRDAQAMIAGMTPSLRQGRYHFCTTQDAALVEALSELSLATIREDEGTTLVLAEEHARQHGFALTMPMAYIVLEVHSALDGVGLTAAVATALAQADIPCHMIAGYHHDHVFVPAQMGPSAMNILRHIQHQAESRA